MKLKNLYYFVIIENGISPVTKQVTFSRNMAFLENGNEFS